MNPSLSHQSRNTEEKLRVETSGTSCWSAIVRHIVKFDMPLCVDTPKCECVTPRLGGGELRSVYKGFFFCGWLPTCWSWSGEAWEPKAPLDCCHVKVSKCKADVSRPRCKNLSRAKECLWSQIYCIFPDSSFSFTMMGDLFLLEDLRGGSLWKIVQRQVLGVFWD